MGARISSAFALEGLARVLAHQGDCGRAVRLFAAAGALRESISAPLPLADSNAHQQELARLHDQLGAGAFEAEWAIGRGLDLKSAAIEALSTSGSCTAHRRH